MKAVCPPGYQGGGGIPEPFQHQSADGRLFPSRFRLSENILRRQDMREVFATPRFYRRGCGGLRSRPGGVGRLERQPAGPQAAAALAQRDKPPANTD